MIQDAKKKIDGIWKSEQGNSAEKRNAAEDIESELIVKITKLSLERKTMYHLLDFQRLALYSLIAFSK